MTKQRPLLASENESTKHNAFGDIVYYLWVMLRYVWRYHARWSIDYWRYI